MKRIFEMGLRIDAKNRNQKREETRVEERRKKAVEYVAEHGDSTMPQRFALKDFLDKENERDPKWRFVLLQPEILGQTSAFLNYECLPETDDEDKTRYVVQLKLSKLFVINARDTLARLLDLCNYDADLMAFPPDYMGHTPYFSIY